MMGSSGLDCFCHQVVKIRLQKNRFNQSLPRLSNKTKDPVLMYNHGYQTIAYKTFGRFFYWFFDENRWFFEVSEINGTNGFFSSDFFLQKSRTGSSSLNSNKSPRNVREFSRFH